MDNMADKNFTIHANIEKKMTKRKSIPFVITSGWYFINQKIDFPLTTH